MSKVKEIEGYVYEYHLPWIKSGSSMPFHPEIPTGGPIVKAKLILDLPERKVEITESEFFEMMRDVELDKGITVMSSNHVSAKTRWHKKMFGDKHE